MVIKAIKSRMELSEELEIVSESPAADSGGWWYKPQYELFPDAKTRDLYNSCLRKRRINLWVLVPFMAITVGVSVLVLPREVFLGDFGTGFQVVSIGILLQMGLQYVLLGLECRSAQIATRFLVRADKLSLYREMIMVAYCLFSPVGQGAILLFRSVGPPCPPAAPILETNFCRTSRFDEISVPNYVCLMAYTCFYQILFPIPWTYHFLSWVIGLIFVALSIASVYTETQADFTEHFVVYILIYVFCGLLQAFLQYMRVDSFLLSPPSRGELYSSVRAPQAPSPHAEREMEMERHDASCDSSLPPPPPHSSSATYGWTPKRKQVAVDAREKSDTIVSEITEATL